jgi:hypothetical protein
MVTPGMSRGKDHEAVMTKCFGVSALHLQRCRAKHCVAFKLRLALTYSVHERLCVHSRLTSLLDKFA